MKKLIIAAGTGFLGNALINYFRDEVIDIVILTRGNAAIKNNVRYINWNAKTMTSWKVNLKVPMCL